jgi:CRISPR-associated endonuclease/helicase Cas3
MNDETNQQFTAWFHQATGHEPYPFQVRFACDPTLFQNPSPRLRGEGSGEGDASGAGLLVDVPTGLGKTAMAVLGWLWRRRFHPDEAVRKSTPRRLVYCLPMRVLVEQTVSEAEKWIAKLGEQYPKEMTEPPNVHTLMGGEDEEDWDIYPEHDQIIVGTQDMLLSRALNRGYAATRSRWPLKFGLLHTDCLWVFDEIQLMGAGLATTAQLEAFRRLLPDRDSDDAKNGHRCRSVWMSATLQRDWLKTVDFKDRVNSLAQLELNDDDHKNAEVTKRWTAKKPLVKTEAAMVDVSELAKEVRDAHEPGTRTIVIVNTVKRACELSKALNAVAKGKPSASEPTIVLLHSRFRPEDRKKQVADALVEIEPGKPGVIVVSTQVIEAGVDVSATTLFTELAPWASLVQRFGRCNRRGQDNDNAAVHWIAMPVEGADAEKIALPYELKDLKAAEEHLKKLTDVSLRSLPDIALQFEHARVIRRKDLIDLFDTTPDLAGNDIDIDRFIRDVEDSDVRVFWRGWEQPKGYEPPPEDEPAPRREELCPAPVGNENNPGFRDFAKRQASKVWRWSFLDKTWEKADAGKVAPGQVYLIHAVAGGYSSERGAGMGSRQQGPCRFDRSTGKDQG